jgi:type IV pilus assembly protein PilA
MKFSCPNCNLAGSIDDAKVPEHGIQAGCPRCKTRFLVKKDPIPDPPSDLPENTRPTTGSSPEAQSLPSRGTPEAMNGGSAQPRSGERPTSARSFRSTSAASSADLINFIGKNSDKYVRKFAAFNAAGNDGFAATWHWPAFLVPFWWLIYRKQYSWAALVFFLSFIPFVGFLSMFALGLTGNYIYYTYSKRKLLEISALPSEMSKAVEMARAGGVNNLLWVLVPLFGIAIMGILAAIAIPQFAAYRMKAYNATAITELRNAKTSVDNYYVEHRVYPDTLEQVNYKKPEKVDVHFSELQADKYTIVSAHQNGDKEYAAKSDSSSLLYRSRRDQAGEFVPIE